MDLIKYDMTDIWAVAGDVVAPDSTKIRAGWGVEVVPRQWWNWFENRQDNNIAYLLQKGFPEWDATTEYITNKSYVQRNGIVYKATATSTNSDPIALTSWVRAFADYSTSMAALGGVTPAADQLPYFNGASTATLTTITAFARSILDDVDAATVRGTISAQTLNSNLTALSGVTPVANGLPYFTSTSAMAVATLTAFGRSLIDDNDAAAARITLGLTTAATTELQSNALDTNAGRILRVGSFGLGTFLDLRTNPIGNATGTPANCFGLGTVFGFADGGSAATNALNIPGITGTVYGTLQVNGQYVDSSGLTSVSRVFITTGGAVYTQTAASSTTWGPWSQSWTTANLVKTASTTDATTGRMLQVGDFGVTGDALSQANTVDANTLKTTGNYGFGNGGVNLPVASTAFLVNTYSHNAGGIVIQQATAMLSNRAFFRTFSTANGWTAWVELYHSGNTAAIVSQVQAGIQPTLDAKVAKAGDTMTGQLVTPSVFLTPGSGSTALVMKSNGSSNAYDATVQVDTPGGSAGTGRVVVTAGTTYLQSLLTVTGAASFQGSISTSGVLTAASASITGNLAAKGVTGGTDGISTQGGVVVTGSGTFAGGTVGINNGSVRIYPASLTNTNAAVLGFYQADTTTIRGAIYANSNNAITIQTGSGTAAATFNPNGSVSLNAISAAGTITATGRITANDLVVTGNVYTSSGNTYLSTDGNVYGSAWGGFLSAWVANNFIYRGAVDGGAALQNNVANYCHATAIGGMAMLGNASGSSIAVNNALASGLTYAAANNANGGTASGTWRCHGYGFNGGITIWMRIA